jgi:hypothetical protein
MDMAATISLLVDVSGCGVTLVCAGGEEQQPN